VAQEGLDLGRPHRIRVTDAVKPDVAFGPVDVALLGSVREMTDPGTVTELIEELHDELLDSAFSRDGSATQRQHGPRRKAESAM
jgi:hypothetical protein